MQGKVLFTFYALMTVLMLQSCQGSMNKSMLNDSSSRAQLILLSKGLNGYVHLENVRFRNVGSLTQVQFGIYNSSRKYKSLEYKVEWADSSGFIVDQSGVWRMLTNGIVLATGKVSEADKIIITIRNRNNIFSNTGK